MSNVVTSSQDFHFEFVKVRSARKDQKDLTFNPGSSQNGRFQEETGERELSSKNGSISFKTEELEHMQIVVLYSLSSLLRKNKSSFNETICFFGINN